MFCSLKFKNIKYPDWTKRELLKKEWLQIWINLKTQKLTVNNKTQKLIWDIVLKATIFLKSISKILKIPLKNKVNKQNKNNKKVIIELNKKKLINKKKPAVTKVLLWTKELIGVGALIAFGNQLIKGKIALLVIEAKTTRIPKINKLFFNKRIKRIKKKKSPIRLINIVKKKLLKESQLEKKRIKKKTS